MSPLYKQVKRIALLAALLAPALVPAGALAQAWPSRPVHIILPFPGGSSTDVFMRVLVEPLREKLGQTIIVEPKPGAGAVVATNYVMAQPPDGYTLMASTSSQTITSAKSNPPFDIRKDLTHVIQTTGGPIFVAVNVEKLPNVKTMKDLVAYAKGHPGELNFGSYGAASLGQLAVELFNQVEGVKTVHVPYKGSPANVVALVNGDSHVAVDVMIFIAPQLQSGKIRVLAATSPERSPMAPEYPGMRESGLPEYSVIFWQGIAGPAGMSRDIVGRLNTAFNAALKEQAVVDYARKTQTVLYGGTPEAIAEIVNREVVTWAKLIKEANINMD